MQNREIKCRAWVPSLNKFLGAAVYGSLVMLIEYDKPVVFKDIDISTVSINEYTGLKDKNGKEIYEGDIIGDQWIEIRYGKWLCINRKDGENRCLFDWLEDNPDGSIVIGNIYENPELLSEDVK